MSANVKYAFKGKIYINGGSYGSPTWNEISAVKGVKSNVSMGEFDATTRQGGGVEQAEPILIKLSLTGMVRSDEGDTTGYIVLETKTLTRAPFDIMVLDGPGTTNGSRGVRYDAKNFKWDEDQDLANILYRDFEIKPCVSANPAFLVVVAGGAPVYTSLAV